MPRAPSQHYEMCRKLPARSDYKFKYSTPAPAVRSRRPSPLLHRIVLMPCSSAPTGFSTLDESNLRHSRRIIGFRYPGVDRVVCATPLGTPLEVQLEDLDRFAKEVMPAFRPAKIAAAAE